MFDCQNGGAVKVMPSVMTTQIDEDGSLFPDDEAASSITVLEDTTLACGVQKSQTTSFGKRIFLTIFGDNNPHEFNFKFWNNTHEVSMKNFTCDTLNFYCDCSGCNNCS